jgi:hypothetical protein
MDGLRGLVGVAKFRRLLTIAAIFLCVESH